MVTLSHINKTYTKNGNASVHALKDVSLEIPKGSFIAIIGASGSGKSTLMNILGLLDRPDSGQYLLEGEEVMGLDDRQAAYIRSRKIGFVFQSFHLLPRTTAIENVQLPLVYSDQTTISKTAAQLLEAMGLGDRLDHYPSQMSGGEQQRVAIARALMNDPEMILADEPTGNLDSESGKEVMRIFQELHQSGRTLVLITHEPKIAQYAQRIVRIADGKIVEDKTVTASPVQATDSGIA